MKTSISIAQRECFNYTLIIVVVLSTMSIWKLRTANFVNKQIRGNFASRSPRICGYFGNKVPPNNAIWLAYGANVGTNTQKAPYSRTDRYDNSFFPFCINNWNNLDSSIRYSSSFANIKTSINDFIRPKSILFTQYVIRLVLSFLLELESPSQILETIGLITSLTVLILHVVVA